MEQSQEPGRAAGSVDSAAVPLQAACGQEQQTQCFQQIQQLETKITRTGAGFRFRFRLGLDPA